MHAASLALSWTVLYFGGFGLAPAVPPQPEPPLLAKVAPAECLFYMSAAAAATPEATSENQTVQLLAEPEVAKLLPELDRMWTAALNHWMQGENAPKGFSGEEMADLLRLPRSCPMAAYISEFKPESGVPRIRGGLVVKVGDDEKAKETLEKAAGHLAPSDAETVEIEGQSWRQFMAAPHLPIVWGFRGQYFLVAIGEGEIEAMAKRAKGEPPKWLAALREEIAIDRVSTITYVNVKGIVQAVQAAQPQAAAVVEALELRNVQAVVAACGLDQDCFISRVQLATDGQPQGIFQAVAGARLSAADFAGVPRDANFALATKLDLAKAFDLVKRIAEKTDPRGGDPMQQTMAALQRNFGVQLREDLLPYLGDTWLIHDSPSAPPGPARVVATVSLKDPQKFAEAYRKLMAGLEQQMANRPGPKLAKSGAAGREIYSLTSPIPLPVAPCWCLAEKNLIFALQPEGINTYLSRSAGQESLADTTRVAALLQAQPEPSSLIYVNIPAFFDQVYPMLSVMGPMIAKQLEPLGIEFDPSILPPAETIRKHLLPHMGTVRCSATGITFTERTTLPGITLGTMGPGQAVALLLPGVQAAREAARRVASINNMKQIALAMHNYAAANKTFPPAYKADKDGKPLLSWRVLILPYLEGGELFKQFHLDEPWDSEHNKPLIAKMPAVFRSPSSTVAGEGKTNYLTPRGENTIFPNDKGMPLKDITDGVANTILTVEAADEKAVEWTKPDDFGYDESDPTNGLLGLHPNGFLAGFADGSVQFVAGTIDQTILKRLFTRNDGEAAKLDQ